MWIRALEKQTGDSLETWNRRVRRERFRDQAGLRSWLAEQGIGGYSQSLLVMEHFGYPDFVASTAVELIDAQYRDREPLRPIFDAILEAAEEAGEVIVQARKTYVSLLTPRRTFARVQAATRTRVDLGLRLGQQKPGGRLRPSRLHETMQLQLSFAAPEEVDAEARKWLRQAHAENR